MSSMPGLEQGDYASINEPAPNTDQFYGPTAHDLRSSERTCVYDDSRAYVLRLAAPIYIAIPLRFDVEELVLDEIS